MTTEKTLAAALRNLLPLAADAVNATAGEDEMKEAICLYDEALALLAAYDAAQPTGFTVCLQEVGNRETTYVVYASGDRYDAVQAAKRECLADWSMLDDTDLHVLAVLAGDVEVLEWEDQA